MSTVIEKKEWLRPSMLPKLAKCGHYRPEADAGEAAARGTKMDEVFRALIAHENVSAGDLLPDDREAVRWAVDTARALSGGLPLFSSEEALRVQVLGLEGTADLLCEEGAWSADLKTGQKRGYVEQQAAYALGFMEQNFAEEWTVYLLFCDLREVETLRFTKEDAERIVRNTIARAKDHEQPPVTNDYCGWCAQRWQCPARREALGFIAEEAMKLEALDKLTSAQLRDFCLRAGVVSDFDEKAREILKERCIGGEKIPGVSLTSKQGTEKAPTRVIELHWKALGTGDILAAYGPMSATKLRDIWKRKLPDTPFPDAEMERLPGSTFVRVGRPKN